MKLPPKVTAKNGRYFWIAQSVERDRRGRLKRRWLPLSRVDEGPAALYDALARLHRPPSDSAMPAIVSAWKGAELGKYSPATKKEYERMAVVIAEAFRDFEVADVRPSDVADFVDQWKDRPRAGNAYRSLLLLIMSYAVRRGRRDDNPVREIASFSVSARSRYLTDEEIARIKAKSSAMTAGLVDLALVTGQRIGDLLSLKWSDVRADGIIFRPAKVQKKTAVAVPIRMTPRLRAVLERCRVATKVSSLWVVHTRAGQPLTYSGANSAWERACNAAGVTDAHFHDLRHRAITDAERQGKNARRLGGHSSKAMTQTYIEAAGLDWIDPPDEQEAAK